MLEGVFSVSKIRFAISSLILLSLAVGLAWGQGIVTGSISGSVQDAQQAVIAGASVTASNIATNTEFKTQTDSEGFFQLKNLPIGTYNVTVEARSFAKLVLRNVSVETGRHTATGVQVLKVGSTSETVTVESAAPLVDTSTSQIGSTFLTQAVASIPLGGTGFDFLALFVPGVARNQAANFSNSNGAQFANNGLRGRSNNFQIDGQGNNDNSVAGPSIFLNNPDVIGEVQIVSSNFSAEYGRNTGTVVNYITKSGTNSFHGSGFEFYTGSWSYSRANQEKNPAQGFCLPGVTTGCNASTVPRFVENRWGGTFGGPIKKDKAWFFASYQNDRQRGSASGTSSSLTPTPDGITALAATYPGNAAVAWLQKQGPYAITAGNPKVAGTVQNIVVSDGVTTATIPFSTITRSAGNNSDDTQVTGRGDWQMGDKNRFFARYIYQKSLTALGTGVISSGAFVAIPAKDQQIGLDFTRTWTPQFVQQTRFSFSRAGFGFEAGAARPNCDRANFSVCPPSLGFSDSTNSYTTLGLANNLPQGRLINVSQWQSNQAWTHGRHTIKFGGEYARQRSPNQFLPNVNGTFTFFSVGAVNAFSEFLRGAAGCPVGSTCSQLTLADGNFAAEYKEQDISFYGQDDWRVADNFTLNLGLRWEWNQQAINLLRNITLQNVADGFWSATAPANVTTLPKIPEDFNNFGPNIGFAYTPRFLPGLFGQEKTVIRGGYRIAYDPAFYNMFLNVQTSAPVVNLGTINNVGITAAGTGASVATAFLPLLPRGANPGSRSQTRVTNNFHNPYTEQWSLGFERKINDRIALETRYVGNHTVGNFSTFNGNPLVSGIPAGQLPAGVTPCSAAGAAAGAGAGATGRVDCNFTNLRVRGNGAWSIYHGLQNELRIRSWHHLTANFAYTWSKAIDNVSEVFAVTTGGISNPAPQNPFDPNLAERAVASQSFPHVFTAYWIYEFPWMRSQQGALGHILGGWSWSGTYRYQSGAPLTPYQNTTNAACDTGWNTTFVGQDSCRPILSNPNAPLTAAGRYLNATQLVNNTTCISAASVGTAACPLVTPADLHFIVNNAFADAALCAGNPFACTTSRNILRAQDQNQIDLSVAKTIRMTERIKMNLRIDGFNVANRMFLGSPGMNINNRALNAPTGATPSNFGNLAFNTSNRRSLALSAHVEF